MIKMSRIWDRNGSVSMDTESFYRSTWSFPSPHPMRLIYWHYAYVSTTILRVSVIVAFISMIVLCASFTILMIMSLVDGELSQTRHHAISDTWFGLHHFTRALGTRSWSTWRTHQPDLVSVWGSSWDRSRSWTCRRRRVNQRSIHIHYCIWPDLEDLITTSQPKLHMYMYRYDVSSHWRDRLSLDYQGWLDIVW